MKRVSWFVLTAFVFVIWAFVGSVHGAVIEESVTLEWEQEMIEDLQPDGGWAVYWGDTPDGPFTRFETSPGVPLFWSVDSVTVITGDPIRYQATLEVRINAPVGDTVVKYFMIRAVSAAATGSAESGDSTCLDNDPTNCEDVYGPFVPGNPMIRRVFEQ